MSILPTRAAIADTAELSRTSSFAVSAAPSFANSARPFSSTSVANTVAPSRANAMAQARPIPAAPAVTNARLPFRRSDMCFLPIFDALLSLSRHAGSRPAHPRLCYPLKQDVDARPKAGHDEWILGSQVTAQ